MCKGFIVVNILSVLQNICQHVVEFVISKIIYIRNWKKLIWLLGLRVWFINVFLALEIFMYIDSINLTFKTWMRNVATYSQYDYFIFIKKSK